jgi:lia operon protein LiaG
MKEWVRIVVLCGVLIAGLSVAGTMAGFSLGTDLHDYDDKKTFAADGLKYILVESEEVDVHVMSGDTDQAVVHLHGAAQADAYHLVTEQRGDRLNIRIDRTGKRFDWGLSAARMSIRLDITVPEKQYDQLYFALSSGDLRDDDLHAKETEVVTRSGDVQLDGATSDSLKVTASSGDLLLRQIEAKTGQITTRSGDVQVDGWRGNEELTVTASSGDVQVSGLESQAVHARAGSGDLRFTMAGVSRAIDAEVTSGELVLYDVSGNVNARATSGDVTVRMKELGEHVDVNTTSGDVIVFLSGTAAFDFWLKSSSGDLNVDFPATYKLADEHRKEGSVGAGGKRVVVETTSGEINVHKN